MGSQLNLGGGPLQGRHIAAQLAVPYHSGITRQLKIPVADAAAKQLALRAVEQLPDDATLEDAVERIYLLEKSERGRLDVREGRTVSHEEVVARFGRWRPSGRGSAGRRSRSAIWRRSTTSSRGTPSLCRCRRRAARRDRQ